MNIATEQDKSVPKSPFLKGIGAPDPGRSPGNNFFDLFVAAGKMDNASESGQPTNLIGRADRQFQLKRENLPWSNPVKEMKKNLEDFGIDPQTVTQSDDRRVLLKLFRDIAKATDGTFAEIPYVPGQVTPNHFHQGKGGSDDPDSLTRVAAGAAITNKMQDEEWLKALFKKAASGFGHAKPSALNGENITPPQRGEKEAINKNPSTGLKAEQPSAVGGKASELNVSAGNITKHSLGSNPNADLLQSSLLQNAAVPKEKKWEGENQKSVKSTDNIITQADGRSFSGPGGKGKLDGLPPGFMMASPYHLMKSKTIGSGIEKKGGNQADRAEAKKVAKNISHNPGGTEKIVADIAAKGESTRTAATMPDKPAVESNLTDNHVRAVDPLSGAGSQTRFAPAANTTGPEAQAPVYRLDDLQGLLKSLVTEAIERHRLQVKIDVEGVGRLRISVLKNSDDLQVHINAGSLQAKEIIDKVVPQLQQALSHHSSNVEMNVSYQDSKQGNNEMYDMQSQDSPIARNGKPEQEERTDQKIIRKKYDWSNYEVIA